MRERTRRTSTKEMPDETFSSSSSLLVDLVAEASAGVPEAVLVSGGLRLRREGSSDAMVGDGVVVVAVYLVAVQLCGRLKV